MLRYRGPKAALSQVKELDAFPKIPETYTKSSAHGGVLSIVTFVFILVLLISEIRYFLDTRLKYKYEVDVEHNEKVRLNFDITVATECKLIGADVLDVTGQAWVFAEGMEEKPASFKLSPEEGRNRMSLLRTKEVLLDEKDGAKLSEIAIKRGFNATELYFKKVKDTENGVKDSCRFFGNVLVNKVTGNFHITAGKPIPLRRAHAHLSFHGDFRYNFSHRINHFSFGDPKVGLINILDGHELITDSETAVFNYYLDAVSTHIISRRIKTHTYQFSVSEQSRAIDHSSGSHGAPGIFFKYTFSPLAVTIEEHAIPLGRFFVRLCGVIGGVFATSVIINNIVGGITAAMKKKGEEKTEPSVSPTLSLLSNPVPPSSLNSPVIS